ncbi:MAG: tetratricopeptide repeat protein [Spirochaetes bacterium ADurb.Bin218]|jgi:tetratricopeptide (TPR) repeat protein|nr:MAG: tetratricopeptide repeat protein [Spirochaetes bacterium ADurb.Bin218]HOQ11795.1 tetratricopeptide repeat protein [Spirochaetota bacterium]
MSIRKIFIMPLFFIFLIFFNAKGFPDIFSQKNWDFYFKRGVIQFNAAMYSDAKDSFQKALDRNPLSFESINYLAEISLIEKNKTLAIDLFKKSLEIENNQPMIHIKLGEILEYFGKTPEALTHYKSAYALDQNLIPAMINYSRMLRLKGDKNSANEILDRCKELNLSRSKSLRDEAASIKNSNSTKAEELYLEAIKANPADFDTYFSLASFYREKRNPQKAIEVMENLKKIKSDYAPAYFYLGNLYYDSKLSGNTRKHYINLAIKNLEDGLKIETDSEVMFHLSRIYKEIGNNEKAEDIEKEALLMQQKTATQ